MPGSYFYKKFSGLSVQKIFDDCGFTVSSYEEVHGGDINDAYCLHASGKKYFLKVNDAARYPQMFVKEARGLKILHQNFLLTVPQVIHFGQTDGKQYLLLEWIDRSMPKKDFWEKFGEALAMMHKHPQPYFEFNEDNYIGSLPQQNTAHDSWHSFFSECRVMPLAKKLFDYGAFSKADIAAAERFYKKTEQLLPAEPPALLHGDLWAGNYMVASDGYAAIYDPAVYFGHREMDIGMTKLFGGFDQPFYYSYHEHYPLQPGWQQRLPLTRLYPLLVHACIFGGHYISSAREIIRQYS
jgi:fructosamine-3-kinase